MNKHAQRIDKFQFRRQLGSSTQFQVEGNQTTTALKALEKYRGTELRAEEARQDQSSPLTNIQTVNSSHARNNQVQTQMDTMKKQPRGFSATQRFGRKIRPTTAKNRQDSALKLINKSHYISSADIQEPQARFQQAQGQPYR